MHKEWKPRKRPEEFGLSKTKLVSIVENDDNLKAAVTNPSLALPAHHLQVQQAPAAGASQQVAAVQQGATSSTSSQHEDELQYVCMVCNAWFPTELCLQTHSLLHAGLADTHQEHLLQRVSQEYTISTKEYAVSTPVSTASAKLPTSSPQPVPFCTYCNMVITEPIHIHLQTVHGQGTVNSI